LIDLFQRFGGDLARLQVARVDKVGTAFGWRPAMPVTQWRVEKP
jgi:precorrin-6Y C5,15-methyltransferase (decarboxylating)